MHHHVRCRWAVSRTTVLVPACQLPSCSCRRLVVDGQPASLRMARKGGGYNKWALRIGMR